MDANVAAVTEALARLDEARVDLLDGADDDARQLLYDIGLSVQQVKAGVKQRRADISRLMARLSRPTLNIGMIGRARMGKSRFLQSLTGLAGDVIPGGRRGFCTGVPSVIINVPDADATAEVHLHSDGRSWPRSSGRTTGSSGLASRPPPPATSPPGRCPPRPRPSRGTRAPTVTWSCSTATSAPTVS
ncbi:MAG TPA: hypothetical protein VIZ43_19050 [Trebonia sp.]